MTTGTVRPIVHPVAGQLIINEILANPGSAVDEARVQPVLVSMQAGTLRGAIRLQARQGEIIGLAGLAGHGQTRMLLDLFQAAGSQGGAVSVAGAVALVAGDRQTDGIFPLWSIAKNISVRSLGALRRGLFIAADAEAAMASDWREKIGIRTDDLDNNILSLSGGNQQKALFARALGSDAQIILMDDPMRGVDVGTKLDVYDLIRSEAQLGRTCARAESADTAATAESGPWPQIQHARLRQARD